MSLSLLDTTRQPVSKLLALREDGSVLADLTAFLASYDLSFTDELKAHTASLVLANPSGYFDKYGNGPGAAQLVENQLLSLQKGFVDLATGVPTLYPAFAGRVTRISATYDRAGAEVIQVDCFDLMKLLLKQKVTTDPYYNTQANLIAADIVSRYGDKYAQLAGYNLAALSYNFPFVAWPDTLLIDILREIYEPALYFAMFGYDGRLTTRPRLGAGGSAVLGYPDQATQPAPDFVFPDASLIKTITGGWQDATDFVNQVRVLGRALADSVTLGPSQVITTVGDAVNTNYAAPRSGTTKRVYFSQQSGGANAVTAQNVYLKIYGASFHLHDNTYCGGTNGGDYKYLASGPGIVNDLGNVIPYPIYDQAFPPGHQNVKSQKGDGRTEGGVAIAAVAPNFVDIQVFANSNAGGFYWAAEVHGQPVLTAQQTLTAIADLAPVAVTETLTDVFGDHQTYQGSHPVWAMGTPVALTVGGASYGTNSADGVQVDTRWQADYERGRVVLQTRLFLPFSADAQFSGGAAGNTTTAYNTALLTNAAPLAVYQSYRQTGANAAFSYTLTGLQVGRGYTVRLHLADPTSTATGQRVFDVLANGAVAAQSIDIYQLAGGRATATIQEITGLQPNINGSLVLSFQNGSVVGSVSPGTGSPLVCGIEVVLPQGTGGVAFAINCGGAAITPAPPVVKATYAYSPSQQVYGVSNITDDNPLLGTLPQCQSMAQYLLNYASWARNPVTIRTQSIPTLYPGMVLQFFHPRLGAGGSDMSCYIEGIKRHQHRPEATGGVAEDETDYDEFSGFLLYVKPR